MRLTRHVIAQPTIAAAHPKAALPDVDVEGADMALAFIDDNETTAILLTAEGAAGLAQLVLRTLIKLGHQEVCEEAVKQAWLEATGGDKPVTLIVPTNTIKKASFIQ